jgi:hypothetical protein
VEYTVPARTILGVVHTLPAKALVGANSIRFRAKSSGTVTLIVALEEKRGEDQKSNYSAAVELTGLAPWKDVTVPMASFHVESWTWSSLTPSSSQTYPQWVPRVISRTPSGSQTSSP